MSSQLLLELSLISSVFVITGITLFLFRRSNISKTEKTMKFLTGLMGGFLLMAGTVKFFDPFTTMFTSQITLSGLPFPVLSQWAGQLGEMTAGAALLAVLIADKKMPEEFADVTFYAANTLTIIIMLVAVYVHLLPGVPAKVLPLQSKPPVLAFVVMAVAWVNISLYRNNNKPMIECCMA